MFGGGKAIENAGPSAEFSARNNFSSNQAFAQRSSISCGSYVFGISAMLSYVCWFCRQVNLQIYGAGQTNAKGLLAAHTKSRRLSTLSSSWFRSEECFRRAA